MDMSIDRLREEREILIKLLRLRVDMGDWESASMLLGKLKEADAVLRFVDEITVTK